VDSLEKTESSFAALGRPESVPSRIRVLVVDDHPLVRMGVASAIQYQKDMVVVGEAGTAEEAVAIHSQEQPDVTLMDLRLPDSSGVIAIRRIRAERPDAHIVVLTTYDGDEDISQALSAGAQGYLIKGMPHKLVLQAIRSVYGGNRFLPQSIANTLSNRIPSLVLTERELEVLQLMFRGFSNPEIATQLCIRETTVKTHVRVVLTKLNVEDRTSAVVEALKRGLVHL
jgi:DNA-binding NarL/FixJ family response regulator